MLQALKAGLEPYTMRCAFCTFWDVDVMGEYIMGVGAQVLSSHKAACRKSRWEQPSVAQCRQRWWAKLWTPSMNGELGAFAEPNRVTHIAVCHHIP